MARFNPNKFRLVNMIGFDPLFGKNADDYPEQTRARDLHTIRNPGAVRKVTGAITTALAGSRVRGCARTRGGAFAPRATSGMS